MVDKNLRTHLIDLTIDLCIVLALLCSQGCFKMSGQPNLNGLNSFNNSNSNSNSNSNNPPGGAPPGSSPAPGGSPIPLAGNFSSLEVNIFIPKCVSCHSQPSPSGNYDMSGYAQVIGGGRVVSFSPTTSKLYTRCTDNTMPPSNPLTTAERQAIYDWINAGANNDGPPIGPLPSPSPVPLTPTFASINVNILQKSCVSCHKNGGDFNASSYSGVLQSVVPGNSGQSSFYRSVANGSMPPKSPLSSAEIQTIKTWIDNGALNN